MWKRKEERDKCRDVSPSHSYSTTNTQSRAEAAYRCCHSAFIIRDTLSGLYIHPSALSKTHRSPIDLEILRKHWVSPLFSPFMSLSVSLVIVFCASSGSIYLPHYALSLWNSQCFRHTRDFLKTFPSVCHAHAFPDTSLTAFLLSIAFGRAARATDRPVLYEAALWATHWVMLVSDYLLVFVRGLLLFS